MNATRTQYAAHRTTQGAHSLGLDQADMVKTRAENAVQVVHYARKEGIVHHVLFGKKQRCHHPAPYVLQGSISSGNVGFEHSQKTTRDFQAMCELCMTWVGATVVGIFRDGYEPRGAYDRSQRGQGHNFPAGTLGYYSEI